jgi:hypothetical protein
VRALRLVGFAAVMLGGLVVAIAAAFVLGAAADSIPLPDDVFDSSLPRWLVGLGATSLLLGGLAVANTMLPLPRVQHVLGGGTLLGAVTTLALLLLWLAAYAGDRVYVRLAGRRVPLPTNLTEDRLFWSLLAAPVTVFALVVWIVTIRWAWRRLTGAERAGRA